MEVTGAPSNDSKPAVEARLRDTCRVCDSNQLIEVLDLGRQPAANAYIAPGDLHLEEPKFPLTLNLCTNCGQAQLGHVVPADHLYRSYMFYTSTSQTMTEHFAQLLRTNVDEFVSPGGLVVEIGSNDGSALVTLLNDNVRVLGVDPSRNISVVANARGIPTIAEFFTGELAGEIYTTAGPADLIVGCNVLGHVDALDDVCLGLRTLLSESGAFVFEVPYLGDLLDRTEYDTIYHEHLSYFAVKPLAHLFDRHGLRLDRVEFLPVHGGSVRGTVKRGSGWSDQVAEVIDAEEREGRSDPGTFQAFAKRVGDLRARLVDTLVRYSDEGLQVMGYGAPAKASVVLNYCGIGTDLLPTVFDSTPAKQGMHVPGTHQPILDVSAVDEHGPDVLLLLAWNHAEEITRKEGWFLERGGRFLTPHLVES